MALGQKGLAGQELVASHRFVIIVTIVGINQVGWKVLLVIMVDQLVVKLDLLDALPWIYGALACIIREPNSNDIEGSYSERMSP